MHASKLTFRDHAYWVRMIHASTTGLTTAQIDAAADICLKTALEGDPCGTWHATATIANLECWCSRCKPEIKRFA